ncbi:MAG: hemolysin family protein [Chlamydia sp.]
MNDFVASSLCTVALLASLVALFFISALIQIGRKERKAFVENIAKSRKIASWYRTVHRSIFQDFSIETLLFSLTCAQHIAHLLAILISLGLFLKTSSPSNGSWTLLIESAAFCLLFFSIFGVSTLISDTLPRFFTATCSQSFFRMAKGPGIFFALCASPISAGLYYLIKCVSSQLIPIAFGRQKKQVVELIEELEDGQTITHHDKRLISSVFDFRHRIAREIMKPRVELFAIPETMSVSDASEKMLLEGYSRVPTYQGSIDNITGILFYKDLLSKYMQHAAIRDEKRESKPLQVEVKTLVKKVFYCPETKKISSLLQEFRKRQMHLAVIVDEYGGTSGVVTIEDILEEIVGEIADEYDDQESLYKPGPKGSWIVDAQMNLHHITEELGIEIPQGEEYDTIAGYIFFRLGTIPKSGMVLHHDLFELKILKSNDRMVEEILITPLSPIQSALIQRDEAAIE